GKRALLRARVGPSSGGGRREPPAHPGNAFGESLGVVRGARETAPLAGRKPLSPKHLHCHKPVPLPLWEAATVENTEKIGVWMSGQIPPRRFFREQAVDFSHEMMKR